MFRNFYLFHLWCNIFTIASAKSMIMTGWTRRICMMAWKIKLRVSPVRSPVSYRVAMYAKDALSMAVSMKETKMMNEKFHNWWYPQSIVILSVQGHFRCSHSTLIQNYLAWVSNSRWGVRRSSQLWTLYRFWTFSTVPLIYSIMQCGKWGRWSRPKQTATLRVINY